MYDLSYVDEDFKSECKRMFHKIYPEFTPHLLGVSKDKQSIIAKCYFPDGLFYFRLTKDSISSAYESIDDADIDLSVYGYVNGEPVYSAEDFRYKVRGFGEITSDAELLKFAEKVTSGWQDAGHKRSFIHFYLSDYALSEPFHSLTKKEFERLKELQQIARDEWEAEQAKYKYENFEGRQMTESEVRMFLDRYVKQVENRWGKTNFWSEQAREHREKIIAKFRAGEVVPVDSYEYNAKYGNGTGAYEKTLYSDGTIRDGCYGYLD